MNDQQPVFAPFAFLAQRIQITPAAAAAADLGGWLAGFRLGTAGYRDLLDPADLHNTGVPFNSLTLAIVLEARAQLAVEEGLRCLHVGGEVRPHTQALIDLAARIYAAHGLRVRLRPPKYPTTPIWLSSFGIFYEELDGGENFTASHSQSFKGGWKPMDAAGGQLLGPADRIAARVRDLARGALAEGLTIRLASSGDPLITRDFDPVAAYTESLLRVVPPALLAELPAAAARGFRAAFCTEGGSMAATARRVFAQMGIGVGGEGPVFFTHEEESPDYHGIGVVDGVNHGVDPGKWQVYKNVGAQDLLRGGDADVFFIWDPDGDRFNMVTSAPAALTDAARRAGLEVDPLDGDRCLVYFKPNQIYFLLTALKIDSLRAEGSLAQCDWIVATSFPTSRSIGELAQRAGSEGGGRLHNFQVPVGFKHFAALVADLERQLAERDTQMPIGAVDVTGRRTHFGPDPRLLIMAEESGGAALGPASLLVSRTGARTSLAPKEKDAMQIGVMALLAAARLFRRGGSFAGWYLETLDRYDIRYRFYERRDVTLFDESLKGEPRARAQREGNALKERTVAVFAELEDLEPVAAQRELARRLPAGVALPPVHRVYHAGDGTLVEFEDRWFELRASGTDAVLRYYMEGRDHKAVADLNEAFTRLDLS